MFMTTSAACANEVYFSRFHFTGKERDAESGNDYFGARYYASSMGRWMSPDPLPWLDWQHPPEDASDEEKQESLQKFRDWISNPQHFNLYAYVLNNPMTGIDKDGHFCFFGHGTTCPPPPPDANHDHTLTVRQVSGQNGNAFGHITVQVDGKKEVGFGPKKDMTAKELAENKSVPGQVEPRAKDAKTLDAVTIHLTSAEARNAQATIDAKSANPGDYKLRGGSCVDFGETVIHSTGAKAPSDDLPSHMVEHVREQQEWDHSSQAP
jgi:RHS repeat-associated protein